MVATIGFFDGVHLGHQQVLKRLAETAHEQADKSMVITFAEHPKADMLLLTTLQERREKIVACGIDIVDVLDFPSISYLTAQEFMHTVLRNQLRVKTLLMGYDHRFGSDQLMDFRSYQALGEKEGIKVLCLPQFAPDGRHISSSVIRNLIELGDIDEADRLLGYNYTLAGTVVKGRGIGHQIGFPTANIMPLDNRKIIPGVGVYVSEVESDKWEGKKRGMLNIGSNPTFGCENDSIEVHVLDCDSDLYGSALKLTLLHRLRGEMKFDNAEALRKQLESDKLNVIQWEHNNVL